MNQCIYRCARLPYSVNDLGVKARPMTNSTLLRAATPNNNTYTLPSSITINSYASLRKLTTPITPLTPLTPAHAHNQVSTTVSLTQCSRESGSRDACDNSRDSGSRDTCQSSSSLSRSEVIVDPSAAELQERFRQMEVSMGHRWLMKTPISIPSGVP